jgi:hypothetical protein
LTNDTGSAQDANRNFRLHIGFSGFYNSQFSGRCMR